jgi:hypothetical protein
MMAGCFLTAIPASAAIVYSNTPGRTAPSPYDGNTDGWTINFGFSVSDSFTLSSATSITGMDLWAWEAPGVTTSSVEYSIGTTFFDNSLGNGTSTGLTDTFVTTNSFGFNIDEISFSFASPISLSAGTYYVTLQNAVASGSSPVYWDENAGPSTAQENSVGTIPSEAFSIVGGPTTGTPEPGAMALVGCGMLLLGGGIRRKLRKS